MNIHYGPHCIAPYTPQQPVDELDVVRYRRAELVSVDREHVLDAHVDGPACQFNDAQELVHNVEG